MAFLVGIPNQLRILRGLQMSALRLVPDEPFPPYTFVPGQRPHPKSDPAGHSFDIVDVMVEPIDPDRWYESRAYLIGLDLFNAGYYWEAHEKLEGLWLAAGRKGAVADFMKGLIKLAAAGVKHLEGKPDGVTSHARRAVELWCGVAHSVGPGSFLGFVIQDLIDLAVKIHQSGWPATSLLISPSIPRGDTGRA